MDVVQAERFAEQWVAAWNAHDLDAVLSHFTEDAVFTSPVAARILPETNGILRGKDAIRGYWLAGMEKLPDLHFEVIHVYAGLDTIVINYRNHTGALVSEVLRVDVEGLVVRGDGTYLAADAAAVSGVRTA